MPSGRPIGAHNEPGHMAGGSREGAGRPSSGNKNASSNKSELLVHSIL